jgi:hypothetical protein
MGTNEHDFDVIKTSLFIFQNDLICDKGNCSGKSEIVYQRGNINLVSSEVHVARTEFYYTRVLIFNNGINTVPVEYYCTCKGTPPVQVQLHVFPVRVRVVDTFSKRKTSTLEDTVYIFSSIDRFFSFFIKRVVF